MTTVRLRAAGVDAVIEGHEIVSGATLEVAEGELVGLVGPNGSGKSTLLRCIYRVLRPASGLVELDGDDVWRLSQRDVARRTASSSKSRPASLSSSCTTW